MEVARLRIRRNLYRLPRGPALADQRREDARADAAPPHVRRVLATRLTRRLPLGPLRRGMMTTGAQQPLARLSGRGRLVPQTGARTGCDAAAGSDSPGASACGISPADMGFALTQPRWGRATCSSCAAVEDPPSSSPCAPSARPLLARPSPAALLGPSGWRGGARDSLPAGGDAARRVSGLDVPGNAALSSAYCGRAWASRSR